MSNNSNTVSTKSNRTQAKQFAILNYFFKLKKTKRSIQTVRWEELCVDLHGFGHIETEEKVSFYPRAGNTLRLIKKTCTIGSYCVKWSQFLFVYANYSLMLMLCKVILPFSSRSRISLYATSYTLRIVPAHRVLCLSTVLQGCRIVC